MDKKAALLKLRYLSVFHDFAFTHRGIKYPVNTLLITAISPVISKLVFCDDPKYSMELPPLEGPIDEFIDLIYGGSVRIDQTNCRFFNYLAKILQITNLADRTEEIIQQTNTLDNVVRFAEQLLSCDLDATQEVNLIASNFLNIIENPYMKLCSVRLVEEILKSPIFSYSGVPVIKFLTSQYKSDPTKYAKLIPLVFSYANDKTTMYSVLSTPFNLNANHNEVTTLLKTTSTSIPDSTKIFIPQSDYDFNGFLKASQDKSGTSNNIVVDLSSSSEQTAEKTTNEVNAVLDESPDTYFSSQGSANNYIQIRIMYGKLQLTHYEMMSWKNANNGTCPESWVVEGSLDDETWFEIDRVEHDRSLLAPNSCNLFKVKTQPPAFNYIRITQLDTCHPKNKRFILSRLELFGIYYEN